MGGPLLLPALPPDHLRRRPSYAQDAEAALAIEDGALTAIHLAADKQLKRLQVGSPPGASLLPQPLLSGSSARQALRPLARAPLRASHSLCTLSLQMEEQLLQMMLERAKKNDPEEQGAEERDGGGEAPGEDGGEAAPRPVFNLREHLQDAPGFEPFPQFGRGRSGRRDEGGPGPGSTAAAAAAAAEAASSDSDSE